MNVLLISIERSYEKVQLITVLGCNISRGTVIDSVFSKYCIKFHFTVWFLVLSGERSQNSQKNPMF